MGSTLHFLANTQPRVLIVTKAALDFQGFFGLFVCLFSVILIWKSEVKKQIQKQRYGPSFGSLSKCLQQPWQNHIQETRILPGSPKSIAGAHVHPKLLPTAFKTMKWFGNRQIELRSHILTWDGEDLNIFLQTISQMHTLFVKSKLCILYLDIVFHIFFYCMYFCSYFNIHF